ncbi:hypothetical protein MBLNU457_7202t1 [Dothideomycetes sp. NU457]
MSRDIYNNVPFALRFQLRKEPQSTPQSQSISQAVQSLVGPTTFARKRDMPSLLFDPSVTRLSDKTLIAVLQDEDSWALVTDENKRRLYAMLPAVSGGKEDDYKVHPLSHPVYGPHIKAYIAHIEAHLESGANKAWEKEAKQASAMRAEAVKTKTAKEGEEEGGDQASEGAKDK